LKEVGQQYPSVFLPRLRDARIAALGHQIPGRKPSRKSRSRSRNLMWCIEFPYTVWRRQIIPKKRHLILKMTAGASSPHRDFLFLQDVCTTSNHLSRYKITSVISRPYVFSTPSGGLWLSADFTADCKRKWLKAGDVKPQAKRPSGGLQPPIGKSNQPCNAAITLLLIVHYSHFALHDRMLV
jgi:hypothetical protein